MEYGDQEYALEKYREALNLFPQDLDARLGIADIQMRKRRFTEAAETLQGALPLVKEGEHWAALGQAFQAARLPDQAAVAYRKSVEQLPGNLAYQIALGNLYFESGLTDSAASIYQFARNSNPNLPGIQRGLGRCFARIGLIDSAVVYFTRALAQDPNNSDLLCEQADARLRLGAAEDALVDLQRSVQSNPYHIQTRYLLGRAWTTLGNKSKADLHLGVFQRQKELASRILALEHAGAERPSAETFQMLAYLYRQRGQDSLARSSLQRATSLNPMLTVPQETGHNGAF
ncbi:MAG: tetratricopeptide repeat protein [bacterium]|nr:tetratricopeptide repeat protein [bacterium]